MDLENLRGKDPFNELDDWADDEPAPAQSSLVHIRIQQRNGRKTPTTCQGIPEQFDLPRIMKAFKKRFCTNGNIVDDPELGKVIQVQGDQRENIRTFLVSEGMVEAAQIKIHGF